MAQDVGGPKSRGCPQAKSVSRNSELNSRWILECAYFVSKRTAATRSQRYDHEPNFVSWWSTGPGGQVEIRENP